MKINFTRTFFSITGMVICFMLCFCTHDKIPLINPQGSDTDSCDTVIYTYMAKVSGIINNQCGGCHYAGSIYGTLTDYNYLKAAALNGSLVKSLNGQGYAVMPPTGKLNACDIKGIDNWVKAGANNN